MGACLKPESINALGCQESEMTTSDQIRILTIDNHPLLLEGLAAVIRSQPDMVLIGQASSCRDAIQKFPELQPDITLMDLRLPDMDGIDALIAIQTQFPEARIIVMTTFEGEDPVQHALQAGARSYIRKNMPPREIADAIRQVHAGKKRAPAEVAANLAEPLREEGLTDYEADGLRHPAGGNRNRGIADKLFIAGETGKAFTAESRFRDYSKFLLRSF
jgi:DNA-binding NarL/FixJ family response regulator